MGARVSSCKHNKTSALRVLLWVLCLATISATAEAQAFGNYFVNHKFNFTPQGDVVRGQWRYRVFTSADDPHMVCGPKQGSIAMPVTNAKNCMSVADQASSQAHSEVKTTNFAPGNVTGSIGVSGFAKVTGNPGDAFSAARSGVTVQGGKKMRNGKIKWGPAQTAQTQGQASAHIHDPISFDVFDPDTHTHTTGTLLAIETSLTGTGSFSWQNDEFSLNATTFDFTIQMTSPFTAEQGTVDFHVRNGVVVGSSETGMFAGMLPGNGSSGDFSTPFSNDLTLNYDLGDMGGNNPDVSFFFDGGGDASAAVPEPSSLFLLGSGILGLCGLLRKQMLRRN